MEKLLFIFKNIDLKQKDMNSGIYFEIKEYFKKTAKKSNIANIKKNLEKFHVQRRLFFKNFYEYTRKEVNIYVFVRMAKFNIEF